MNQGITLKAPLEFGFLPTHAGFVETLFPNEEGQLPRSESGSFVVVEAVKLHARAFEEAGLADSCVENWNIEFLRPGEFQTFTDLGRLWVLIKALNEKVGQPFFRCLIDAAHCGDSALSIEENQKLIAEVAAGGGLGVMHASAPTTRGCRDYTQVVVDGLENTARVLNNYVARGIIPGA